jgi:hypothetical protein
LIKTYLPNHSLFLQLLCVHHGMWLKHFSVSLSIFWSIFQNGGLV